MELVLGLPIFWPRRTVIAEPDSLLAYRQRPSSAQLSAAELYHENSKLFPAKISELVVSNLDPALIRQEFLRRRAVVVATGGGVELQGTAPWRAVLSRLATAADPELFYAIEVRAVAAGRVGLHEPIHDALPAVKLLDAKEQSRLHDALRLLPTTAARSQDHPASANPWLLLVAWFSRNEILFGTRGYRRTLLEAGRVAEEILRLAHDAGLDAQPVSEFADRDVDAVMEADGIEQATLMAIEITEAQDERDKGVGG